MTKILSKKGKTREEFLAIGTFSQQAIRRALNKTARESVFEEFLSCMFIHNSDNSRYK